MNARKTNGSEEETDAALLAAFVSGDVPAMDRLVSRYRNTLFPWLQGMTGNRSDAEDLFQDIWVKIIRNAKHFHDISFKAWMWKIARNRLIDFRRKKRTVVSLDAVTDDNSVPMVEQLASPDATPVRKIELDDMIRRVMEAVAELPDIQREVFLMRTQGNLSFIEIARTLEIPLNTALGRMHDAIDKLKKALAAEKDGVR